MRVYRRTDHAVIDGPFGGRWHGPPVAGLVVGGVFVVAVACRQCCEDEVGEHDSRASSHSGLSVSARVAPHLRCLVSLKSFSQELEFPVHMNCFSLGKEIYHIRTGSEFKFN